MVEAVLLCSVNGANVVMAMSLPFMSGSSQCVLRTSTQMSHQCQWMAGHLLMSHQMAALQLSCLTECMVSAPPIT